MLNFDESHKSVDGNINNIKGTLKRIAVGTLVGVMILTFTGCNSREALEYHHDSMNEYYTETLDESSTTLVIMENNKYEDLELIPILYPSIEKVIIDKCPNIDSLDFLYGLPNLTEVTITECPCVSQELIDYLNSKGIKHNLTIEDVELTNQVDGIINQIITEDMDDEARIQAICDYVINNFKYKLSESEESNEEPLTWFLENGSGVCASYSYLTSVLLTKAGVTNYPVSDNDHGWNMVEMDGKYYYIDCTNIAQIPILSKLLLKYFNVGFFYMSDPAGNSFSAMSDYDSKEVILPQELIEDIEKGEDAKNIIEKYRGSVPANIIMGIIAIAALSGGIKVAQAAAENRRYKKRRYR